MCDELARLLHFSSRSMAAVHFLVLLSVPSGKRYDGDIFPSDVSVLFNLHLYKVVYRAK